MAAKSPQSVADASVIAKWFLVERHREDALRLRDDFVAGEISIASPSLMPFEVLNAVRFSSKGLDATKLKNAGKSLSLYAIELFPLEGPYLDLTVEVSLRNGLSIYDASYLALAKRLGAVFYTADESLIAKLRGEEKELAAHVEDYRKP